MGVSAAFGGNLALIEKRLIELEKLNEQAVKEVGEIPQNGSVTLEARIKPGVDDPTRDSGISQERIEIKKKTVLALDKKQPFTVQISASRSQKQSYRVAAMLRRTGYPAFTASIVLKDQGLWHRIFVGSYATREEAEKTRQDLEKDEIVDVMIRKMPYAIQIGDAGPLESLKGLRDKVASMEFMPYTTYVRETTTDEQQTRLLVGAYENKEEATELLSTLRSGGLAARVVNR